jgi:DnaJ family protein A protein 2
MILHLSSSRRSIRASRLFSTSSKFYDLLKVPSTASEEDIKKAYKKAALEHHPDRGGDSDKFKEISHAYSVLSDPTKRQLYDQFGERGVEQGGMGASGGNGEDPMDIFSQVFGGASRRRSHGGLMRGRDAIYNLELSLEEIASGTVRTIAFNRDVACGGCGGRGATKIDPCKRCGGSGVVMTRQNIGFLVHMQTACPDCNGEGYRVPRDGQCRPCKGSGVVSQKETFEVKVPRGSPSSHQFRFSGKADQLPGHTAGDVIVQIKVKEHPFYRRLGDGSADLVVKKEVSLTEALTGCEFEILDLENKQKISVNSSSAIIAPEDVWIVRGKGLPRFDGSTRGDAYVKFQVKFPSKLTELSEKEKERLQISIFGSSSSSKTSSCLSSLFKNEPTSVVEKKEAVGMEKCSSKEMLAKISQAFETNKQEKRKEHMHVDPQQCQQQ